MTDRLTDRLTDRVVEVLTTLDDPVPPAAGRDAAAIPAPDPVRLADGALARARSRTRRRRVAVAAATPLVAAATVLAVALTGPGLLSGLRPHDRSGPATGPLRALAPWGDADRVSVLLVGSDAGSDRVGARADTIVLASVDTRTGDTVLLGLPRNRLGEVSRGTWRMDNGLTGRTIVPDVERLTGITPDATITVTMHGLVQVVDTFGGVTVTVPRRLPVGGVRYVDGTTVTQPEAYIRPGRQKLDGYHALWFARSRFDSDDDDRMHRQRCLLAALATQVDGTAVLRAAPALVHILGRNVSTDIRLTDLPAWVGLLEKVRTARIRSAVLNLPMAPDGSPDYAASRRAAEKALASPDVTDTAQPPASPGATPTAVAADPEAVDVTDVC